MVPADAATSRFREMGLHLWRVLLLLLFAVWWGGLTFYAARVVPIATEQIGSTEQGFITQEVTRWHHGATAVLNVCLALEAWRSNRRELWFVVAALSLILALLSRHHRQLTEMMDFSTRTVSDGFYQQHAIYLWLTTAEWLVGIGVAFFLVGSVRR